MTTDKDIVLAPEEVIKAKETLSRIEKPILSPRWISWE